MIIWLSIKNSSLNLINISKFLRIFNKIEILNTLLSHNVTTSHVSPVIETVLKLVNKKPNKLPSTSTVNNMNIQRLILAQKQLGEEYAVKKNTTILSDETTKFGLKFEGFHAADACPSPGRHVPRQFGGRIGALVRTARLRGQLHGR